MTELKHNLTLDMDGNLDRQAKKARRSMEDLGRKGASSLRLFDRSMSAAGRGLDKLGNKYTALLSGGTAYAAVKQAAALETRLTRLALTAGKSDKEIKQLNDRLWAIAQERDINIDPSQLMSAVEQIVEKTGDMDLAADNMRNIAYAISAAGIEGADAGKMIGDMFEKFNIRSSDQMLQALDKLSNQGKEGAFTLKDMASQGERVFSAYASIGRGGADAVAEMGALLQMIKKGTGSPEQAATALEAYLRALNDVQTRQKLTQAGIQLTDPQDPKRLRSAADIMKDIIKKADGETWRISSVFNGQALRAFSSATNEFNQTKAFDGLDGYLNVVSDGKSLMNDSARVAATFESAVTSLITAVKKFSNGQLAEPIQKLANALNKIEPAAMENIIKNVSKAAVALGALVIGKKAWDIGSGIFKLFSVGKGGIGGMVASATGVQPVYVTNFDQLGSLGGLGGLALAGKAGKASNILKAGNAAKNLSKLGKAKSLLGKGAGLGGKLLSKAAVPLMVAGSVAEFATADDNAGRGSAVGSLGGTLGGAKVGALIGTAIAPGIGTAIGGLIGSGIGAFAGSKLGQTIGGLFDGKKEEPTASANTPSAEMPQGVIRFVFDNAPAGLRVKDNPLGFEIKINTGRTEASYG